MRISYRRVIIALAVSASLFLAFIVPISACQNPVDITDSASYILIGEVKDIKSLWEDDLIYSYVTIFVVDVEKGLESLEREDIVVKCVGGGIDDVVLWQSNQPTFAVGEIVRLYLRQEDSIFIVIGGAHGKVLLDSKFEPVEAATLAGYKLFWFNPGVGWTTGTSRPGLDWYGPLRWDDSKIPVEYWIDTRNIPSGITASSFIEYVGKSYQTWEDDSGSYMDYTYMGTRTDKEWGVNDGVNIFCWRYIDGSGGTLGVCAAWAQYYPGDYDSLRITDADIKLDTGDPWSAANTCPSNKFDVQNVGTHEIGHNLGLADLYDSEDSEMTMYGYASPGETKKRTLEWGDQAGIHTLYPAYIVTFKTNPVEDSPSITFDGTTYTHGQTGSYALGDYTAVANPPSASYAFHHWEYGDGIYVPDINSNPTTVTVSGDGWLKAVFSALITFRTNPAGVGSITYDGATYTDGQSIWEPNLPPDYGKIRTITANVPSGYTFISWGTIGKIYVSDPSSNPTTLTVNGPGVLTVNLPEVFTISLSSIADGQVDVGAITFDGVTYTLPTSVSKPAGKYGATASPPTGLAFDHWETSNGVSVANPSAQTTQVTIVGDGTLRAVFKVVTVEFDISPKRSVLLKEIEFLEGYYYVRVENHGVTWLYLRVGYRTCFVRLKGINEKFIRLGFFKQGKYNIFATCIGQEGTYAHVTIYHG